MHQSRSKESFFWEKKEPYKNVERQNNMEGLRFGANRVNGNGKIRKSKRILPIISIHNPILRKKSEWSPG